jgi:FHA domain-containing protein
VLILIVAEGPDKGRIYEWTDDQTVIVGRESKDLRLSDGKASRQHARFKCEGGKWYVRDLASRHGTLVNKIRTDGKHPLGDGDRVRIGRTELVVARMPAEQVERAALMGDQPIRGDAGRDMPARRRYIPRATTAAALAAAAFAIGCSAWLYMNTTDANLLLREDLLASQNRATKAQLAAADAQAQATETQLAISDRTDVILNEVMALGSNSTPVLNEILASVQSQHGNTELLGDINEALAQMHNSSMTTLDTILAGVESQSAQWHALAKVEDTMSRQQDQTALLLPELKAVAVTAQANESALTALKEQIELAQARPDLDAQMLDQLEAIIAELQARPTLDQVADEVRNALAVEQEKTSDLLTRIEGQLAASPDTRALIAPLRDALAQQGKATDQLVAQAFQRQEHTDGQLEDLNALVRAQPGETATALGGLIGELNTQADVDEVLAAVKRIEAGSGDTESLRLLGELALKLESAPTSQQLADAVASAVTTQLDGTRPLLEQIASSLDTASQQTEAGQALVAQLRLALVAQEAADTRLDQIYDLLATTEAGEDSEAMRQVLREIRSKSIAGMDELRSTIRREIQAGLTDQRLATSRTMTPLPHAVPESIVTKPKPVTDQPGQTIALAAQDNQNSLTATESATVNKDGMTDVEHAYRLAFKTGKPITLGGGSIDPKTGGVTEGRTLDPSAAKAAGITDWRDWYLMDDFAERMRLQQQAIQFHDDHRGPNVLSIPADVQTDLKIDRRGSGG